MKIKDLSDYIDLMHERYPYIPKDDLMKILVFGFEQYDRLNRFGADVHVCNGRHKTYCGHLFNDDTSRAKYILSKRSKKLRWTKAYEKYQYNGRYYFGLTEEEWNDCMSRRSKTKIFKNIKLYKLEEECLSHKKFKHFFYINYPIDVGWSFVKDKLVSKYHVYFAYRDENNNIIMRDERRENWNS